MSKTLSTFKHLECSLTGDIFPIDEPMRLSPSSDKPLLARYDLKKAAVTLTQESLYKRRNDMWRYQELLPVLNEENIVSLGELITNRNSVIQTRK